MESELAVEYLWFYSLRGDAAKVSVIREDAGFCIC